MASEPKTIEVEPGGELDRLLDEAGRAPLRLVRGGERFRLDREDGMGEHAAPTTVPAQLDRPSGPEQVARAIEGIRETAAARVASVAENDDIWANYDPELAIEGIRKAAGAWRGLVDAEAFKAYVRERRLTKNRPPARW